MLTDSKKQNEMKEKYNIKNRICLVFISVSLFMGLSCTAPQDKITEARIARLEAVRTFADNVLENGADRWSGQDTPLLADGINLLIGEPVEWVYNGDRYMIHNLASQQNLFRTFAGLSNLTGDEKYRNAAKNSIRYHFDNLRSDCGLLRWGGHQIIDLRTLEPVGHFDANCHEFKNNFPFYELMWEVDEDASAKFLKAFWNAHIFDWERLDMNRHGRYGLSMGNLWNNQFIQPEPFFEGDGLTFINAGSDLIYAGSMLYILGGEKDALDWATLLAQQYVRARHPETGLGVYQYSKPVRRQEPPEEGPLTGRLTYSSLGDRAENQFGKYFPGTAREGWVLFHGNIYTLPKLIQLEISERLGKEGRSFLNWSVEGLKAFAAYAYDPLDNSFRPMWADGTDLSDFEFPRTGYYGEKGRVLKPYKANEQFLFSYSRAYRLSRDEVIWETVRSIFKGLGLGDPGEEPGINPFLEMETDNSNPYALFAIIEIGRATGNKAFLDLAGIIGNNIVSRSFHNGYFLPDSEHINANFNAIEPLALISLEAALRGDFGLVPVYSGGRGYLHGRFDGMGRTYDIQAIWSKKK